MTKLTPVKITYLKIFQRNLRTGGWACCMSQGLQVVERMWMDCFTLLDNVEIPTCVESYMARGRELESTRRVQGPRQGYTCSLALRAVRQTAPGNKRSQTRTKPPGKVAHARPHPKGRSAAWDRGEKMMMTHNCTAQSPGTALLLIPTAGR